jgi:hypothetical protein
MPPDKRAGSRKRRARGRKKKELRRDHRTPISRASNSSAPSAPARPASERPPGRERQQARRPSGPLGMHWAAWAGLGSVGLALAIAAGIWLGTPDDPEPKRLVAPVVRIDAGGPGK